VTDLQCELNILPEFDVEGSPGVGYGENPIYEVLCCSRSNLVGDDIDRIVKWLLSDARPEDSGHGHQCPF